MTPDEWMDGEGRPAPPEPTPEELELAARIKETFYAYTNRTDRSQQSHLGPSEAGTPCDRRLALHMLGMQPVNPGGDNWASFKGTCIHAGLAEMFTWANAGTGRYAVEVPLALPSAIVPRGTADRVDRTMLMCLDDKCMGAWSMDKFKRVGPSPTYITQVHLYAYAARRRGERVDRVAIVAWPVESTRLDDMAVWVRPYDATIAPRSLARCETIASRVRELEDSDNDVQLRAGHPQGSDPGRGMDGRADQWPGHHLLRLASEFDVADACRFCPYHAPDDSQREFGCNGKQ